MRVRKSTGRTITFALAIATTVLLASPALGGGRPLSAELSPGDEVPPAAGSEASGTADVTLNQGQGEVCFDIQASGFASGVFAAHIHDGAAGVNGPVVVTIFMDPANPIEDFTGIEVCAEGIEESLVKDIRQNPDEYYINIHSTEFPGGEIRGQLSK